MNAIKLIIIISMMLFSFSAFCQQHITGNLSVAGKGCIGENCTNSENLGGTTLRLKADNTRIDFDDTSTGNFPANDWRIGANESAANGANLFYIQDLTSGPIPFSIYAGAPNNSFRIASTGNISLGTDVENGRLNVNGDINAGTINATNFNGTNITASGNLQGANIIATTSLSAPSFSANGINASVSLTALGSSTSFTSTKNVCIGAECGFSETFTNNYPVVIKQPNIRMLFDDASFVGSFPSNDWAIQINAAAPGGDSYFGIEDVTAGTLPFKVLAGTPTNMFQVDSSGIHIMPDSMYRFTPDGLIIDKFNPAFSLSLVDGDSPTIRFDQTPFVGYSAHVWEIKANENRMEFKNVTNNKIPIWVETAAPHQNLWLQDTMTTIQNANIRLIGTTGVTGDLTVSGEFTAFSDRRLKTDITDFTNGLDKILGLRVKAYKFNTEAYPSLNLAEGSQIGLIAQEVEGVIPQVVSQSNNKVTDLNGNTFDVKAINYVELVPVLIKAMQEQQQQIDSLQAKNSELEKQVAKIQELELILNQLNIEGMTGRTIKASEE